MTGEALGGYSHRQIRNYSKIGIASNFAAYVDSLDATTDPPDQDGAQ